MRKIPVAAIVAGLLLVGAYGVEAAGDGPAIVAGVKTSGLEQVDSSVVLNGLGIDAGDVFSFESIQKGVKNLYTLGYFSGISVEAEETPQGVFLNVVVSENPRVTGISFEGVKALDKDTIKEKLTMKENAFFSPLLVFQQRQIIADTYREEGFPSATVSSVSTREKDKGKVEVVFEVDEGKKVRVKKIDFEGNKSIEDSNLRKAMDTRAKSWWRGGKFKQVTFDEDLEKIVKHYQSQGLRDARVVDHQLTYSPDGSNLFITITVEEGKPYTLGSVTWAGSSALGTAELGETVAFKEGERYDVRKVEKTLTNVYSLYAERGYVFVDVKKEESVVDNRIDLKMTVQEGP
ncbi:MAG: POTRA domain-containing protein, partial [Candidatus Eisenbacteria bacterium]